MSRARAQAGLLALLTALAGPAITIAAPPEPEALAPAPEPAGWPAQYPRFRGEEIGLTLALLTGLTATTLLVPTPPRGFRGEWSVDRAAREALRIDDPDGQRRVATVSDVLQNTAMLVPVLVDIGVGALLLERDLDLAMQMALIDAEVLMAATSMVVLTKRTIGRVRPNVPSCADGGYGCRSNSNRRAFISGHSTAAFAAAGTSCVHHRYLRLFGGVGDDLMCAGMLTLAGAASLMRVVADKHWLSDTLVGGLTGLLSGYALPYLLHYQGDAHWAGKGDGELDGSLTLSLLGGTIWGEGRAGAAGGVEAAARQLVHVARPLRLELGMQGRLLYDHHGFGVRQWQGQVRTWLGPVALGATTRYRALHREGGSTNGWSFGPSLAFGTFDEASPWLLALEWQPLGGHRGHVAARLEWSPWRYIAAHLEVSPHVETLPGGTERLGASATLGLGGRLPW